MLPVKCSIETQGGAFIYNPRIRCMMEAGFIFFSGLALVAIASALGMLFSRNAVYSALFLILNFSTIAVFYLILNAPFIAMAQITVYAGAIMVLFLFVIMLLGAQELPQKQRFAWQRPLAISLGMILLVNFVYVIFFGESVLPEASELAPGFGGPLAIGETLFTQYLLPFEVTSVLLLVALIGAIVLNYRQIKS